MGAICWYASTTPVSVFTAGSGKKSKTSVTKCPRTFQVWNISTQSWRLVHYLDVQMERHSNLVWRSKENQCRGKTFSKCWRLTRLLDKLSVMAKSWQMTEFVHLLQLAWEIPNPIFEVKHWLSEVGSSFLWLHGQLHELSITVHAPNLGSLQGLFVSVTSTHSRGPFPQCTSDFGGDAFARSHWRGILFCYNCDFVPTSGQKVFQLLFFLTFGWIDNVRTSLLSLNLEVHQDKYWSRVEAPEASLFMYDRWTVTPRSYRTTLPKVEKTCYQIGNLANMFVFCAVVSLSMLNLTSTLKKVVTYWRKQD